MPDDVDNIFEKEILNEILGKAGEKTSEKCTFFRELAEEKIDYDKTSLIVTHLVVLRIFLFLFIDLKLINLYKIKIQHLEGFEIQIFNNFKNIRFNPNLRTQIRKQLSESYD